jgi:uncharacterized protein YjbJ (UPF0337 family)
VRDFLAKPQTMLATASGRSFADTCAYPTERRVAVGFLDKLLGRGKKAAGDVTGDSSLRSEGTHQEMKAEAEERAEAAEETAQKERAQAAGHEAQQDTES